MYRSVFGRKDAFPGSFINCPQLRTKCFYAIVYTKENVAAKALADQISDLAPPTRTAFGRLLGCIEEGKGEAYATKIDVRCSDRNRVIAEKHILIATGGFLSVQLRLKQSGLDGPHRWGIILPNSSRVSLLTYKAIVAVRYPELVLHDQNPIQIGYFVTQLLQHGFQAAWFEVYGSPQPRQQQGPPREYQLSSRQDVVSSDRKRMRHPNQPSHINGEDNVCMLNGSGERDSGSPKAVLFFFIFFLFCFLDERDSALDYVSVLHQFTFAATTATAFA